jgi:hypothetical protein
MWQEVVKGPLVCYCSRHALSKIEHGDKGGRKGGERKAGRERENRSQYMHFQRLFAMLQSSSEVPGALSQGHSISTYAWR